MHWIKQHQKNTRWPKKLFNTVSGCSRDDLNLEPELSLRITQNDYILWMILRANPMPPFL